MADGSTLDTLLQQMKGGLSAGPEAPLTSPGLVKKATAPADVPMGTSENGMAGIMAVLQQAGGLTPQQYSGAADKIVQQINQATAPAIQAVEQNIGKRQAIMEQPIAHPVMPQLQGMPKAPNTTIANPIQVFSQSGAIFAMLASVFTRRPMVTAMNAAAAAIKGYAEGDKAAAERAHQSWKDSLDQALAQNQAEMDQYNILLNDTKLSQEERTAQLQALAASNQDQNMLAALKSGAPDMAFKILDGRQKSAESLMGIFTQAQQHEDQVRFERERLGETERHDAQVEALAAGRYGLNMDGTMKAGGPLDEPTAQMLAEQYLKTGKLPSMGYGAQGIQVRKQVFDEAAKMAGESIPDIATNAANYQAQVSSLKNLQTFLNRADTAQNTFLKNVQQVDKYSTAGVAGELPVINKWIQAGRRATGDADVTAFDTAVRTAAREYARVMSGPASNAQLQVSAQANADEMINDAMNADQLKAAITVMNQDVSNMISASNSQMQTIQDRLKSGGSAPAGPGAPFEATLNGQPIYSNDGSSWYDATGTPVGQ